MSKPGETIAYRLIPPIKVEPFFPKDEDKNKVFEIYRDSRIHYYYRWFEGSYRNHIPIFDPYHWLDIRSVALAFCPAGIAMKRDKVELNHRGEVLSGE